MDKKIAILAFLSLVVTFSLHCGKNGGKKRKKRKQQQRIKCIVKDYLNNHQNYEFQGSYKSTTITRKKKKKRKSKKKYKRIKELRLYNVQHDDDASHWSGDDNRF